jgi:hypothetical protein
MAWTVLVPLLANLLATTPAQAADPYNVTGTKQIQSVGGKCAGGNPSTLTFTDGPSSVNPLAQQYPAGTFEGQQLNLNNEFIDLFIITNVSPNNKANPAQGAYTANITTKGYELHAGGTPTTPSATLPVSSSSWFSSSLSLAPPSASTITPLRKFCPAW